MNKNTSTSLINVFLVFVLIDVDNPLFYSILQRHELFAVKQYCSQLLQKREFEIKIIIIINCRYRC
jgi:hypothetical protein